MRLLFVDDERRVLSGIENAMLFGPDQWLADFADSGQEAIDSMAANDYDVVVTDMMMPGLTGADVLEAARHLAPEAIRIILSGRVGTDLAQRSMPLAHEFVSKPCSPEALFKVIERTYGVWRSLVEAGAGRLLTSLESLPAAPGLCARIQTGIDQGDGVADIATMIESDVAITSGLLRLANSAFFGFASPATSARDAVVRLGVDAVLGLVVHTEVTSWVQPSEAHLVVELNGHATRTSHLAHRLIGDQVPQARMAGLLHDIGRLAILAHDPVRFHQLRVAANDLDPGGYTSDGGTAAEVEHLATDHAELGARMLEMWRIDPIVVEAAAHHHQPTEATGEARQVIDAINAAGLAAISPERLATLGVPDHADPDLIDRARNLLEGLDQP